LKKENFRRTAYTCLLLFAMSSVISACAQIQFPGIVTIPAPGLTRIAAPARTQIPSATATQQLNTQNHTALPSLPLPPTSQHAPRSLPNYTIAALIDYENMTMDVQQEIDVPNPSKSTITEMLLGVQPNRIPGVFELVELRYNNQTVNDYTLEGQRLQWKLTHPFLADQTARISVHYRLNLPTIEQGDPNLMRPQIFGVTPRQINLTDWYPMLVPYKDPDGWLLHDPWAYGEHLVYPSANFDVTLRFTDPTDVPEIASSGANQPGTDGSHYILQNGRDFVFAMGKQMKSKSDRVGNVTVNSFYYPGSENAGQAALDTTLQAVKTYSALFGNYSHQTLTVVQGDFNDGMEFDGLYYLSNSFYDQYDDSPKSFLVTVAAHETSHQWWFGRVANDQNNEPWMDEALATYCEKLFYEKNHPEALDWWWAYRIDFYQPEGKIDGSVPSYGGFTPYTNATYRQGARFFDELRQQIGDETFYAFLKDYAAQMDGKIANSADFFRILSEHNPADVSTLESKYFSK